MSQTKNVVKKNSHIKKKKTPLVAKEKNEKGENFKHMNMLIKRKKKWGNASDPLLLQNSEHSHPACLGRPVKQYQKSRIPD